MLSASSRWKPIRSATRNDQAIMIGARLMTTNLPLSAYYPESSGLSTRSEREISTNLLIQYLVELQTANLIALLMNFIGQKLVMIVLLCDLAFLYGRSCC